MPAKRTLHLNLNCFISKFTSKSYFEISLFIKKDNLLFDFMLLIKELNFQGVFSFRAKLSGKYKSFLNQFQKRQVVYDLTYMSFSVQLSSVAQSCPTLCDPMNRSTPGLPVHHQLPEFTQTHVHRVRDAIQPSHPLSFPSPPAPNPSQHQSLFQ